jgi:fructose-bisphosphate aldolase class I
MPLPAETPFKEELIETARTIAQRGRGILAADESTGTIGKRFAPINVENVEDNRRAYREILFTTKGLGEYISGVILFEETLYQNAADGTPFVKLLKDQGIVPGIKVDKGVAPLGGGATGETSTQGNDGLADRCKKYYEQGARFAKWRAVLQIDASTGAPTELAIRENAYGLARYASICQWNGLVPIVEPEVLMDGSHTMEEAAFHTQRAIAACYKALQEHNVLLEGTLLKPNMVRQGTDNKAPYSEEQIASLTVRTLQRTVPPAVPGIMFLSGGMSEEEATVALNLLNSEAITTARPWSLSFSYGRALQASVLKAWEGKPENADRARAMLLVRAKANSMAQLGKYDGFAANPEAAASLHVKNYSY